MYCRHCTRKRKVGDPEYIPSREQIQKGINYIEKHTEIRDVLLSGGDPFMLPDEFLELDFNGNSGTLLMCKLYGSVQECQWFFHTE